ncbi:MAG: hypothetical protein K2G04_02905 [Oscillospiraceae bacterium]|nr:hypothetical protein [Oscillospiraceae bacterium]
MKNPLSFPKDANLKLEKPGDNLSARITPSGREVIKVYKNNGAEKYAAVKYPNGKIVKTKSEPPQ